MHFILVVWLGFLGEFYFSISLLIYLFECSMFCSFSDLFFFFFFLYI